MKAEIEAGMHQNNFRVQSTEFRRRYFHSTEDSAVMTQSKTLDGVLMVKNCCVTKETKFFKPN